MTNGDYIRSLTDEQLADIIDEMCGAYNPCRFCVTHKDTCDCNCAPNVEIWLKRERNNEFRWKPCPFCGENIRIDIDTYKIDSGFWYYAHCEECLANGPLGKTEQDAVDAWNERG